MFNLSFLNRRAQGAVLWNATEHTVQLAKLGRLDARPLTIEALAEFAPGDDAGIAEWVRDGLPERGAGFKAGYCGFHPSDRVLWRDGINAKRLAEPDYLPTLLAEGAKVPANGEWHVAALNPIEGEVLTPTSLSRPGLVLGVPLAAVREQQQRLRAAGVRPRRLEVGSVTLLGALTRYMREAAYPHATVACEIGLGQTRVYFLAKDGVHTPATLPHGLVSIMETAMKELGLPSIGPARDALFAPSEELREKRRRLVRMLTRHLKPAIDYFEMQTGQPIGALHAAHLPGPLGWLEEGLGEAVELEFFAPDMAAWLKLAGLQLAPGLPLPPRPWFQALGLVGQLGGQVE